METRNHSHTASLLRRVAPRAVLALSGIGALGALLAAAPDEAAASRIDTTPPRQVTGLVLERGGWKYDCMECHTFIEAKWHHDRPLTEHRELELKHGNNRFCLNCHHPQNRNAFVDYDGSEIAEADVVDLCAKCHGPQHRDWKAGVHGRQNGYWDAERGPKQRLLCIQCHDPHDPKFKPMAPMPAPVYPARAAGQPRPANTEHKE